MENIQSKPVTAFQSIMDFIDRLPQEFIDRLWRPLKRFVGNNKIFFGIISMGFTFLFIFFLRKTKLNRSFVIWTGLVEKNELVDESVMEKTHKRAMFLVRESARLVATALDIRNTNVLEAYENAAQAAVMARTAKEMDSDVSKLSDDLGVDFYEYLSYTGTVLQSLRDNVWR